MLYPSKITQEQLAFSRQLAQQRFPDRDILVLGDNLVVQFSPVDVNMSLATPFDLQGVDFERTIFIYASDQDDVGMPFIQYIAHHKGKFLPAHSADPSAYVHHDRIARAVIEEQYTRQWAEKWGKWDFGPSDFANLLQAIQLTAPLEGDFVEVGTFEGSGAAVALSYMKEKNIARRCYFFDVFEGFNYAEAYESPDALWQDTHGTSGLEKIKNRLTSYTEGHDGIEVNVIKMNVITDELPPEMRRVACANIDVDLYEAVAVGLRKVAPLIVPGGIMICEDPGHTLALIGARLAMAEFLATDEARLFTPIYLESGQYFLLRRHD